jgi:transposase
VARNGRRRWSSEPKRAIVAAGFAPGAVVRDVARQNDVTSSLIYRCRELRAVANGFARVLMAPAGDETVTVLRRGGSGRTKEPNVQS